MPRPVIESHLLADYCGEPHFVDRLTIDLATAKLFHAPHPGVTERARQELLTIRDILIRTFPCASIMLTGSFSTAEGQVDIVSGVPVIRSDYDFFVVSPNFCDTLTHLAAKRLNGSLGGLALSTHVEIGLVWERLLHQQRTTIGGAMVGGRRNLGPLLEQLPAPSAPSALLQSYRALSVAPLYPEHYARLCSKSLMRAAQAFLLDRCRGMPRRAWIGLSSISYVKNALRPYAGFLGGDVVSTVARACDFILGEDVEGPAIADHARIAGMAGRMADQIAIDPSRLFALKHFLWLCRGRHAGVPRPDAGRLTLTGLRALAEAWTDGSTPAPASLESANRALRGICFDRIGDWTCDPVPAYTRMRSLLSSLAGFNPHRVSYGPSTKML